MFTINTAKSQERKQDFNLKTIAVAVALCAGSPAFAAATGGFSTTDGGNVTGAKSFSASTYEQINTIIANAKLDANGNKVTGGAYPLIITYTGNEDALINQVMKDHTVDASGNCPKPRWNDAYRFVEIKEFTKGITIIGANGSSANFGVVINKSNNVIVRNMKIGALAGANNDADMIRICCISFSHQISVSCIACSWCGTTGLCRCCDSRPSMFLIPSSSISSSPSFYL